MTPWIIIAVLAAGNGLTAWALLRAFRRNGALGKELDQERRALDAATKMLNIDRVDNRDELIRKLLEGAA